jgi:hypothetical protein
MDTQHHQTTTLLAGLENIFKDFDDVCQKVPANTYQQVAHGACIGGHMRHILEFFKILADQAATGSINYERRARDVRFEQDPALSAESCAQVITKLRLLLSTIGADAPIMVEETPGFGLDAIQIASSFGREMLYVIQHSVHHFAIVKMMARAHDIAFSDGFGVASATQTYRAQLSSKTA